MNEKLRYLLEKANVVFWAGGNPRPIMKELDLEIAQKESFCLLSQNRVLAVVSSLNEMTDLFFSRDESREIRTGRFLNSKSDILETLAKGVIHQSLTH